MILWTRCKTDTAYKHGGMMKFDCVQQQRRFGPRIAALGFIFLMRYISKLLLLLLLLWLWLWWWLLLLCMKNSVHSAMLFDVRGVWGGCVFVWLSRSTWCYYLVYNCSAAEAVVFSFTSILWPSITAEEDFGEADFEWLNNHIICIVVY